MTVKNRLKNTNYKKRLTMLKDAKQTWVLCLLTVILVTFITYMLYHTFGYMNSYEVYDVHGASMYPTINANQSVDDKGIVDSKFANPQINDIIMYTTVIDDRIVNVTKRLVATGGDKLTMIFDGEQYYLQRIAKGTSVPYKVEEDYVTNERDKGLETTFEKFQRLYNKQNVQVEVIDGIKYVVIPEGYIFFMGDNRLNSNDCSNYGPQSMDGYRGKLMYLVREGKHLQWYQFLYALGFLKPNI